MATLSVERGGVTYLTPERRINSCRSPKQHIKALIGGSLEQPSILETRPTEQRHRTNLVSRQESSQRQFRFSSSRIRRSDASQNPVLWRPNATARDIRAIIENLTHIP